MCAAIGGSRGRCIASSPRTGPARQAGPPRRGLTLTYKKEHARMKSEMLINVSQPEECRIAIIEDGLLEELYIERASQESFVGNIYKGRIVNLEPSIQAAFVDFGVGRNGFLHISDVEPQYFRQGGFDPGDSMSYGRMADIDVGDDEPAMAEAAEGGSHEEGRSHDRGSRDRGRHDRGARDRGAERGEPDRGASDRGG